MAFSLIRLITLPPSLNKYTASSFWERWEDSSSVMAFWFSFTPEGWDGGMGLWPSGNPTLERLRAQVRRDPAPVEALARRLATQDVFVLSGESYKKHRFETTPLLQPWVDKKWLGLEHQAPHDELSLSDRLFPFLREGFDFLLPYYEFFLSLPKIEESHPATP